MKYNAKYDRWVSKDGLVYRYDKKNDKLVLCAEYITPDKGYVIISLSKPKHTPYKLHRIVWETFNGEIPDGYEIDHIDGNKQNNVLSNLRCVTHIENMANPITKERFRLSNNWSNSVKDFLPKFLNLSRSFLLNTTNSPNVSTSAAFKQLRARTERSISTNLVLSN